jgi:hypothetical protein
VEKRKNTITCVEKYRILKLLPAHALFHMLNLLGQYLRLLATAPSRTLTSRSLLVVRLSLMLYARTPAAGLIFVSVTPHAEVSLIRNPTVQLSWRMKNASVKKSNR